MDLRAKFGIAHLKTRMESISSESKQIVITGMHRSGTSLVANLLQSAGVNIGERLHGSNRGNLHGHFEDLDFYDLHEGILKRAGMKVYIESANLVPTFGESDFVQARSLIEQRKSNYLWGWKDPRTCLFLNSWHHLLPNPCYVFLYRHPLDVVLSLLRRGMEVDVDVLVDPWVGLHAWQVYNQRILDFYTEHPEISLLCHISSIAKDIPSFVQRVADRLSLPLESSQTGPIFHSDELSQGRVPPEASTVLGKLAPATAALYRRLEESADMRSLGNTNSAEPQRTALLILQNIVASLTDAVDPNEANLLLPLLLQTIDAQAVGIGRLRLKEIFCSMQAQISLYLDDDVEDLALAKQWEAQTQKVNTLVAQVVERQQAVDALTTQLDAQTHKVNSLVAQVVERQQVVDALTTQLDAQTHKVNSLVAQVVERQNAVQVLSSQLAQQAEKIKVMSSSRSWDLTTWRALINKIKLSFKRK